MVARLAAQAAAVTSSYRCACCMHEYYHSDMSLATRTSDMPERRSIVSDIVCLLRHHIMLKTDRYMVIFNIDLQEWFRD